MARPKKNNADYFPHDADMRNDRKIKALRTKFGHVGYSIYVMLIESLTDADFFELDFDTIGIELLAGDFDVDSKELCEIVDYCILLGLIQGGCDSNKIWSDRHKKNFEGLMNKRKRDRIGVIASGNPQSKEEKKKEEKNRKDTSNNPKPKKPVCVCPLENVSDTLWKEFIDNRKFKKLQNTDTAIKTITNSFRKGKEAGFTYENMINEYISSRWTRFDHEWMKTGDSKKSNAGYHQGKIL